MGQVNGAANKRPLPSVIGRIDLVSFQQFIFNRKLNFNITTMGYRSYNLPLDVGLFHVWKGFSGEIFVSVPDQAIFKSPEFIQQLTSLFWQFGEVIFANFSLLPCPRRFAVGKYSRIHRILCENVVFAIYIIVVPAAKNPSQPQRITMSSPVNSLKIQLRNTRQRIQMIQVV